ncbi:MAG: hypothetical protein IPK83_24330 [Planctomycetes bacterium]|nr:hypothetical protein [Planctomycetota bacterium]
MKRQLAVPATIAFAFATTCWAQTPLSSEFTYQGRLHASGFPAISTADFQFSLLGAATGGAQIGTTLSRDNVALVDGVFTTSLDFGASAFAGQARWLEIAVRSPAGVGGFTTLTPRQPITATPNATFSQQTRGITVNAAGNVGIGTSFPTEKLTVSGLTDLHSGCPQLKVRSGTSSGFVSSSLCGWLPFQDDGMNLSYNYFSTFDNLDHFEDPSRGNSLISLQDGQIILATSSAGQAPLSRMQIDEAGVVSIYTPGFATAAKLEVSGTVEALYFDVTSDLEVFGGRQETFGEPHLIWKLGDYLTQTPQPVGSVGNPELKMISPVTGDELAGFYRDFDSGNGVMFADDKNFRAPNPADPATDIWYCCPEGPEAAMYVRGTARLTNGRATIELPDHFRNLASEPGMTVQLTPGSVDSKGLVYIKKSLNGIEVAELGGGTGNYEFDWRVEAVRKGWEDYKVIRPWLQSDADPDKAWQNRLKMIEERRAHGKPSPAVSADMPRPTE